MSARVLITGAAGGIGAAASEELRRRGAQVVGLDLHGDGVDVLTCDVRDQASVNAAVAEGINRLGGGLDVLINNAGLGTPQSAGAPPDDTALAVIDVNMLGPWRVTAAALAELRASRGRVINVASGLVYIPLPFTPAYSMSKRGVVAYSDALRVEHGDAITVTTVYPGYVRTSIHDSAKDLGVGLEGMPAESLESAAHTLARAALDAPVRDLATTRAGAIAYALLGHVPRRLLDAATVHQMRQMARRGHFDASPLASDLGRRLRA